MMPRRACVWMSMKPGETTRPAASIDADGRRVDPRRDERDGVALDRDVGDDPRAAGAVHDPAAAEDEVVMRGTTCARGPDAERGREQHQRGYELEEHPFLTPRSPSGFSAGAGDVGDGHQGVHFADERPVVAPLADLRVRPQRPPRRGGDAAADDQPHADPRGRPKAGLRLTRDAVTRRRRLLAQAAASSISVNRRPPWMISGHPTCSAGPRTRPGCLRPARGRTGS